MLTLAYLRRQVPRPPRPTTRPCTRVQTRPVAVRGFSRTYWQYAAFTAPTLAGFATFAVLAYHLQHRHVVRPRRSRSCTPSRWGVAALASLASGEVYDRIGLRGLLVLPLLGAVVPFCRSPPRCRWSGWAPRCGAR